MQADLTVLALCLVDQERSPGTIDACLDRREQIERGHRSLTEEPRPRRA